MSESVDNVSKKVLSNDYSSMMPGSIEQAYENGSPPRGDNELPDTSALELVAGDFANRNKRKRAPLPPRSPATPLRASGEGGVAGGGDGGACRHRDDRVQQRRSSATAA